MIVMKPRPFFMRGSDAVLATEREHEKPQPHPRKAAGTQITHSQLEEVVTINNDAGPTRQPR